MTQAAWNDECYRILREAGVGTCEAFYYFKQRGDGQTAYESGMPAAAYASITLYQLSKQYEWGSEKQLDLSNYAFELYLEARVPYTDEHEDWCLKATSDEIADYGEKFILEYFGMKYDPKRGG